MKLPKGGSMKSKTAMFVVFLFAAVACLAQAGATKAKRHVMVTPENIQWGPINPAAIRGTPPADFLPLKSEVAVVSGDPSKPGAAFVVRIKTPDGGRVPPHWHPQDENITVLQGIFFLGTGEKFDRASGHEMKTGSYALMPKSTWHFGWVKGETIVQVHGTGPFLINFGKIHETAKKVSQ
jgi:quercetin dioxygenase-like cupin family protein